MNSIINSLNNMRWNKFLTIALPISILLFTQACAPRRILSDKDNPSNPTSSIAQNSVKSLLNHGGN
ncbi:hypothetical protein B4U84_16085 [Westiellopsis prolifica IICB1]|nr:hypothetical protein B4U84_16085 [Westiellopsis prolifica IICB1]